MLRSSSPSPPHAVRNYNNGQVVRKQRTYPSFVNLFRKEGFQTAAFVSLGVLASEFGLNKGSRNTPTSSRRNDGTFRPKRSTKGYVGQKKSR